MRSKIVAVMAILVAALIISTGAGFADVVSGNSTENITFGPPPGSEGRQNVIVDTDTAWSMLFIDYANGTEAAVLLDGGNFLIPDASGTCWKTWGPKWRTPFPHGYYIDTYAKPADFLTDAEMQSQLTKSLKAWDKKTSKSLWTVYGVGDWGSSNMDSTWANPSHLVANGYNTAGMDKGGYLHSYWGSGTIGLCYMHGSSSTTMTEFDIILNDYDFNWNPSSNPVAGQMIVRDIATHEAGHACGLLDRYTSSCSAATMFGMSSLGETKKISLSSYDIKGLRKMYGA